MRWEDIGGQVIAGLIVLVVAGLGGWLVKRASKRGVLGSRAVQFVAKVVDYGRPFPGLITWRIGEMLDVEVHPLTRDAIILKEVGLEMVDGSRIKIGTTTDLDKQLKRPEFATAEDYIKSVRESVAKSGSEVKGFYARATPDKVYRQALPKNWKGFPAKLPPFEKDE